jgi:hypothetical protein
MAHVGIQTTKTTLFRGVQQEIHNVYYYRDPAAVTTPSESLIDEIVTNEKAWHSSGITFVRASAWSAGGTNAQNQMLFQKNLSGAGSATPDASCDKERAYLLRWPAGFDVRGLPVYLRKWYHTAGGFGTVSAITSGVLGNTGEILPANRTSIANLVSALNEVGVGEAWDLCSATGREWQGQPTCHRYLEHHQLGDMWR